MSRISAALIGALLLAFVLGARLERRPPPNRSTRSFVSDTARRDANVSTHANSPKVTNGGGKGDSAHPLWTAHFDVRHAPYTMRADVWFPPPPDSARLQVGVTLDTIPLLVHIVCAPTLLGFRTPMVTVESVSWAHVRIDHVDGDASVCMQPVDPLWRRRLIELDATPPRSH